MARQLYDYWFVQFDFPDENGKPYKSSGGKMVWNKRLKRDIPDGWNDCTLHRYIGRITNGLNPRQNFVLGTGSNYYVSIRSLEGRDINWESCEKCDDSALTKINSRSQLQCGDVIFSAIGTIGRTYYIQEDPNNWNISETSFAIRPSKDIPSSFFYELLISPEIQMQADKNAMGSTMRCLVMDALCKIPTMDISTDVVNKFNNIIAPIHDALYERNKEKRKLYKLREVLLPLLMNGQVSVMQQEVNCDLFKSSSQALNLVQTFFISDESNSYMGMYWHKGMFQLFLLMRLTMTLTIVSFSSVRLSAIMRVRATRVLSAMRLVPSSL